MFGAVENRPPKTIVAVFQQAAAELGNPESRMANTHSIQPTCDPYREDRCCGIAVNGDPGPDLGAFRVVPGDWRKCSQFRQELADTGQISGRIVIRSSESRHCEKQPDQTDCPDLPER